MLFTSQCRLKPFFHKPLPNVAYRALVTAKRLSHLGISPVGRVRIDFEQDIGVFDPVCLPFALLDYRLKRPPLLPSQPYNVLLNDSPPPALATLDRPSRYRLPIYIYA